MPTLTINGKSFELDADPKMPLLWAIRDYANFTGTKYGCGVALCGACTVHIDGEPVRSCQMQVRDAVGRKVTTIEGVEGNEGGARRLASARCRPMRILPIRSDHDRDRAFIEKPETNRCGYQ